MPVRFGRYEGRWYHRAWRARTVSASQRCIATGAAWRAPARGAYRRRTSPPLASTGAGCSRRPRQQRRPRVAALRLPDRRALRTAQTVRVAVRTCRPATCPRACPSSAARGRRARNNSRTTHSSEAARKRRCAAAPSSSSVPTTASMRRTRWRSSAAWAGVVCWRRVTLPSSPSCARTGRGRSVSAWRYARRTRRRTSQSARASRRASSRRSTRTTYAASASPAAGRTRRSRCRARHLATGSACCASATSTSSRWTSRAPSSWCSRRSTGPGSASGS